MSWTCTSSSKRWDDDNVACSRCCAMTVRWADIPGLFLGNGLVSYHYTNSLDFHNKNMLETDLYY
jgi:hypothetical protein